MSYVQTLNDLGSKALPQSKLHYNAHDLSEQRFGRLTALTATTERWDGQVVWLCRCDCGEHKLVRSYSLLCGATQSCGCLHREVMHQTAHDLTGQRFELLTVLSAINKRAADGSVVWECQCDCGDRTEVASSHLLSGHTRSCGCLTKKHTENLEGECFGSLEVKSLVGKDAKGSYVWECQCECGATIELTAQRLISGHRTSCGHRSHLVERFTGENNPNWKGGITPKIRKLRTGRRMGRWREAIYERDAYTCQICGQQGGELNAHHLESFADNPDLRFCLDNGVTLCRDCHIHFHSVFGTQHNTRQEFESLTKAMA